MRLAESLGAEIVGADALQLYADLPILSAAPDAAEQARVPHYLVGVADASQGWSVGRWLQAAQAALSRDRPMVVAGGTGLYFRALTQGLAQVPPLAPEVRAQAQVEFEALGEVGFRDRLARADPAAALRISPGDKQRLVRAWEVYIATGRSLSQWQGDNAGALPPGSWRGVVLEPPRELLYGRCDARFETMIAAGALNEAARLAARDLPPHLPAMKAVGYRELCAHLRGEISRSAAIAAAQMETRRYAKRQTTWARGQMGDWPRITASDLEGQWRQMAMIGH